MSGEQIEEMTDEEQDRRVDELCDAILAVCAENGSRISTQILALQDALAITLSTFYAAFGEDMSAITVHGVLNHFLEFRNDFDTDRSDT